MTWKTYSGKLGGLGTVFAWRFRRSLPFTALYCAAMLGVCLWPPYHLMDDRLVAMRGLMLVAAFLLPAVHLGCCFSRPRADVVHALPVGRGSFFLGSLASSLASLWLPVAPSLFLRELICGFRSTEFIAHLAAMLVMGAAVLVFFTLAAVASGTYIEYGLNALLLSALYPLMMAYLFFLLHDVIPGSNHISGSFEHFMRTAGSPPLAFAMYMQGSGGFGFVVVWHGLLAVALACLGYWLYCRRPSERSGMARRCRGMELFLRVELALTAACFAGHGMDCVARDFIPFPWGVPLALGTIILSIGGVWLATELFYHHGLRKLGRHWRPLALSLGIMTALLGAFSTGLGLDTAMPAAEEIVAASMNMTDGTDYIRFGWPVTLPDVPEEERNPWEVERHDTLWPALTTPEGIEKVRTLQQKIIQMERAVQFPYLPGRSSNWARSVSFLEYDLVQGNAFWFHFSDWYDVGIPQRAKELGEEIQALKEEIFTSEEYVNSLLPLNALEALDQVEKSPRIGTEGYSYVQNEDQPRDTARKVSGFSQDFRQKLEEAMRADFSAGRFPTAKELLKDEGQLYKLFYQPGVEFTAQGGAVTRNSAFVLPAAGRPVSLAQDYGSEYLPVFRVTWEMTETFAVLEEEWNRPQKSAR